MTNRTDLPSVSAPNFEQRIRETLMTYLGRQGDPLDRGLTLRDLIENGIIEIKDGYSLRPGAGSIPLLPGNALAPETDLTPPPQPTGFDVGAAISHIFIEHNEPTFPHGGGYLRTRVYGATWQSGPLPVFEDAVEITQFSGQFHAHPSNPSTTWRLWIKWESRAGVLSATPAGGTNGLAATTGQDVSLLLDALTGQLTESELYADLNSRINLIDGPASLSGSVASRIQTEATTRESADSALASSITTLSSTVNSNAAAIQTLATTVAGPDGATAQYTVKVQANGYVAGFGLSNTANNATPFSEFAIVADKFSIAPVASNPAAADGSPFFYLTTPTTIGGVQVPAGAYMKAAYIHDATITTAKIADLAVDNAKVANLSADKITFGSMSGERIQTNTLDASSIRTSTLQASTNIIVDAGQGRRITIFGEGYLEANGPLKRTVMDAGNVTTFLKVPSVGEVPYQALAHVEVGTCQNATEVTIPGYFAVQPKVIVSPAELGVYNKDFASQSQTLICATGAVTQTGANTYRWKFTPTATLSLLGTEQGQALNVNSGAQSVNNFTTTIRQAPGNTDQLTVDMQFLSVRSLSTVGSYAYRRVTWYIQYSTDQTNWTNSVSRIITFGESISNYVSSSITTALPSPQAWYWRVVCVAEDAGGTFSFGGSQYEFATDTIGRTDSQTAEVSAFSSSPNQSSTVNYNINYTLPGGWEITSITGTLVYDYLLSKQSGTFDVARVSGPGVNQSLSSLEGTRSQNGVSTAISQYTGLTYTAQATVSFNRTSYARITITSASVTIQRRRLLSQVAATTNHFNLVSRTVRIAGAQILATGTLNWMAVGE
jgi:hypothetical protein